MTPPATPARLWGERVVPHLADASLRGREIGILRDRVCAGLHGRVLEVGFGSGLNVRCYPAAVSSVSAVEPSDVGWQLSERRRARSEVPVERTGLDGQRLLEGDETHDTALITFSLCTIPAPVAALGEVARVLRPGGTLHLLEHGLAPEESVRRWQRRLEPLQRRLGGGCHLTRDIAALVEQAGFEALWWEERPLLQGRLNRPWTHGYLGCVTRVG